MQDDANHCKSTNENDRNVVIGGKKQRSNVRYRGIVPPSYRRIGPAKWAIVMGMYVSGELSTLRAVAEHLGCGINTVTVRSDREGWREVRDKSVKAVLDKVRECDGVIVARTVESVASIASAQSELVSRLLNHGRSMCDRADDLLSLIQSQSLRLDSYSPCEISPESTRRFTTLSQVHLSIVDTIRVLAGLPHPDNVTKQPMKPVKIPHLATSPQSRSNHSPLGADPDAIVSGMVQEKVSDGPLVGSVPPDPTPTRVCDPDPSVYGGPTFQSESSHAMSMTASQGGVGMDDVEGGAGATDPVEVPPMPPIGWEL